ncbi:MAG: glycosyltransferase family 39 protein [Caldilineaceae bacterium]|nr:glycosyltransferase family 39 protein [Caldilineaceae bacterium]
MHYYSRVPTIRTFLLGLFWIGLAVLAQVRWLDDRVIEAALLYATAIIGFVTTFRGIGKGDLLPADGQEGSVGSLFTASIWRRIAGLLLVIGALVMAVVGLRDFHAHDPWNGSAWLYYAGSIGLALVAAALLTAYGSSASDPRSGTTWQPSARTIALLLTGMVLLGLFLRLYRFGELPFGVWYDEAENGIQAQRLLEDPNFRPIYANSTHAPAHYTYLIAWAFRLFGVSVQSIRLVSVAMGVAAILAGYLCGRELFGPVAGLITGFLLAVSRWSINLSRIGMYNISTPLFALLTVGLLLRALRTRRLLDFALAGLALGLGLTFYAAFQLLVAALALFALLLIALEPQVWRRAWPGFLVALIVAVLVTGPVLQFAYDHPDIYFDRTQNTSIFAHTSPDEWRAALWENTTRHLLMFNRIGDPNGRHNLPGAPMLDPISAALLALGAALALWRWRQPRWLLLLIWPAAALLGGILSLDFEAPQSLRAVGALPVVYLLAAGALNMLWLAWSRQGGRYYPAFFGVVAALLLVPVGLYDGRLYFHDQARDFAVWNAFSTPETITARLLNDLDPDTDATISALFHGHPTLRFLAPDARPYGRLETDARFPLPVSAERGLLLVIDADRRAQFEALQRLYPQGVFIEHRPPFGGPVSVYEVRLSPADLASLQGLDGAYYPSDAISGLPTLTRRDPTIDFTPGNLPLTAPFTTEWQGVLRVSQYGDHGLRLDASGPARLWLDETLILDGSGANETTLRLAEGNHRLRLQATLPADNGTLRLSWQPPDAAEATIIPAQALYHAPVTANGLLGSYFANDEWQGPPALQRVDPSLDAYFHILPLARPYTVEWTGMLAIPETGRYGFGLASIDESTLWIDGEEVTASPGAGVYAEGMSELTAGLHPIRVRFADRTDHTHITLFWRPPWGGQERVPSAALFPPLGAYDDLILPTSADLQAAPETELGPAPPPEARGQGEVMLAQLNAPVGIAAGADRIYVADTGGGRVLALDEAGVLLDVIEGQAEDAAAETHFVAPFDLAARGEMLFVLDPQLARVIQIDMNSGARTLLPISGAYVERARGLFADEAGTIWLAHTPSGRIAAFGPDGTLLRELAIGLPGAQPIDVAVTRAGEIVVSDGGTHQLLRYAADGALLRVDPLPAANSLEATHLAVDGEDRVLLTEPEAGRVVRLSADGGLDAAWSLMVPAGLPAKPVGIAVDAQGRIWVTDSSRGEVLRVK